MDPFFELDQLKLVYRTRVRDTIENVEYPLKEITLGDTIASELARRHKQSKVRLLSIDESIDPSLVVKEPEDDHRALVELKLLSSVCGKSR